MSKRTLAEREEIEKAATTLSVLCFDPLEAPKKARRQFKEEIVPEIKDIRFTAEVQPRTDYPHQVYTGLRIVNLAKDLITNKQRAPREYASLSYHLIKASKKLAKNTNELLIRSVLTDLVDNFYTEDPPVDYLLEVLREHEEKYPHRLSPYKHEVQGLVSHT